MEEPSQPLQAAVVQFAHLELANSEIDEAAVEAARNGPYDEPGSKASYRRATGTIPTSLEFNLLGIPTWATPNAFPHSRVTSSGE